jgi:hypothetical protein
MYRRPAIDNDRVQPIGAGTALFALRGSPGSGPSEVADWMIWEWCGSVSETICVPNRENLATIKVSEGSPYGESEISKCNKRHRVALEVRCNVAQLPAVCRS